MRFRGIAVGTVIALIVMVSVTAYALWKIWEATTLGYRAIAEYAISAYKSMLR